MLHLASVKANVRVTRSWDATQFDLCSTGARHSLTFITKPDVHPLQIAVKSTMQQKESFEYKSGLLAMFKISLPEAQADHAKAACF